MELARYIDRTEAAGEMPRIESRLFRIELASRRAELARDDADTTAAMLAIKQIMGLAPESPLTLAQLRVRLTAMAGESKPPVIRIRGDATVPYQKVAELFNEVQKAGLTRFTIDAQTK